MKLLTRLTAQCPEFKQIGVLLTNNVLIPASNRDYHELRRLPLLDDAVPLDTYNLRDLITPTNH